MIILEEYITCSPRIGFIREVSHLLFELLGSVIFCLKQARLPKQPVSKTVADHTALLVIRFSQPGSDDRGGVGTQHFHIAGALVQLLQRAPDIGIADMALEIDKENVFP